MNLFSKHTTDIGKTNLAQMSLIPKENIKPLDQNSYTLPLKHHIWLRKERDLERAGIITSSTSNFASLVIKVPK